MDRGMQVAGTLNLVRPGVLLCDPNIASQTTARLLDRICVLCHGRACRRNFRGSVDFLRKELDRVGPVHADLCRDFFSRAVALELSFFEAAYTT